MSNSCYKECRKLEEIVHNYHRTGKEYYLNSFYKEAYRLTSYIYNKKTKNSKAGDSKDEVVHDVLTATVLNLKNGAINVEKTAWSRYLGNLIRNRLSWTHVLNGKYEYRKSIEAGQSRYDEDYSQGEDKVYSKTVSETFVDGSLEEKLEKSTNLLPIIESFCKRNRKKLPLQSKISQDVFLFMVISSLFEDMFFGEGSRRTGILKLLDLKFDRRFTFLFNYLSLDFKKLIKESIDEV